MEFGKGYMPTPLACFHLTDENVSSLNRAIPPLNDLIPVITTRIYPTAAGLTRIQGD
jgi:hypothetical protein